MKFKELHHGVIRSTSTKMVYTIIPFYYRPCMLNTKQEFNAVGLNGIPAYFENDEEVELLSLTDITPEDLKLIIKYSSFDNISDS